VYVGSAKAVRELKLVDIDRRGQVADLRQQCGEVFGRFVRSQYGGVFPPFADYDLGRVGRVQVILVAEVAVLFLRGRRQFGEQFQHFGAFVGRYVDRYEDVDHGFIVFAAVGNATQRRFPVPACFCPVAECARAAVGSSWGRSSEVRFYSGAFGYIRPRPAAWSR
jgi:hypothetical protein